MRRAVFALSTLALSALSLTAHASVVYSFSDNTAGTSFQFTLPTLVAADTTVNFPSPQNDASCTLLTNTSAASTCSAVELYFDGPTDSISFRGTAYSNPLVATGALYSFSTPFSSFGNFTGTSLGPSGTSGTLSVTASTPEPSSFVLLGSGLLGAVGALRKKLA